MNSASNTATSLGFGAAMTILVNAWLARFNYAPLSADEAAAYMTVGGTLLGYYLHLRSTDPSLGLFLGSKKTVPTQP